jgi:hypothetical protein
MNQFLRHFFVFCLLFFVARLSAQENTNVRVTTQDGSVIVGTLTTLNDSILVIKATNLGDITLQRAQVTNIETIAADGSSTHSSDSRYWYDNPHTTRYYFNSNGYGLRKGEGYYQNTWVLYNQVSLGLSDYFSMGVGAIPTFLFGSGELPIWVTPKVSLPVVPNKFNVGIGAFIGTFLGGFADNDRAGIVYGNTTFGSREKNFTLGIGYAFFDDEWARTPTFNISGMSRISRKFAFVTENYIISADGSTFTLASGGIRYIAPALSIDASLFIPITSELDRPIALPWVSITVPFELKSRKKKLGKIKK